MFHATQNDFGMFFLHIIPHFSHRTEANHLTLVKDPSTGMKERLRCTWEMKHITPFTYDFCHISTEAGTFCGSLRQTNSRTSILRGETQPLHTREKSRITGTFSHSSSLWPMKSQHIWSLQNKNTKSLNRERNPNGNSSKLQMGISLKAYRKN